MVSDLRQVGLRRPICPRSAPKHFDFVRVYDWVFHSDSNTIKPVGHGCQFAIDVSVMVSDLRQVGLRRPICPRSAPKHFDFVRVYDLVFRCDSKTIQPVGHRCRFVIDVSVMVSDLRQVGLRRPICPRSAPAHFDSVRVYDLVFRCDSKTIQPVGNRCRFVIDVSVMVSDLRQVGLRRPICPRSAPTSLRIRIGPRPHHRIW